MHGRRLTVCYRTLQGCKQILGEVNCVFEVIISASGLARCKHAIRCTPQTPHSVFLLFNQIRSKNVAALYFILFIFLTQVVSRNCFLFYISVHPAFEQYIYIYIKSNNICLYVVYLHPVGFDTVSCVKCTVALP